MTDELPLDSEGRMVCLTCHECISGTCVLRKASSDLCRTCHDCKQGMSCLIGVAHLGSKKDPSSYINECLSCHDGVIAKQSACIGEDKVDIYYLKDTYFRVKGKRKVFIEDKHFKPVRDRKIVFVKGKITCISCHNPYGSEHGRLVMSMKGGKLCLSCHLIRNMRMTHKP